MGRETDGRSGTDIIWDLSVSPPPLSLAGDSGVGRGGKPPPTPAGRLPPPKNQLAEGKSGDGDRRQLEIDRGRDTKKRERTGQGEGSLCKWQLRLRGL